MTSPTTPTSPTTSTTAPSPVPAPPAPGLRHRFSIRAEVGPYRHVTGRADGALVVIPITGGTVSGAGLDGVVMPGGADWAVFRDDGSVQVEARYQVQTAAGAVVDVVNTGLYRPAGPAGAEYFATAPVFRTDAPEHRWLRDAVFLGWATTRPEATTIDVFEVLEPRP